MFISLSSILYSQKQGLKSIIVSEIKDACGCSDAMERIADVLVKTTKSFTSIAQAKSDPKAKPIIDLSNQKSAEVAAQCEKLGFTDYDIKSCPSFKLLKEKSEILNKKFK